MRTVFADTSFYVAILSPSDARHSKAKAVAAACLSKVVTTQFILIEVGNFFCRGNGRAVFLKMMDNLLSVEDVEIVPASSQLFHDGLSLFRSRPDKDWSLTDCASFVVMQECGLTEALTADHHFEQAGFTALLE